MSSRRAHDTHPGASGTPHHDQYQRWIPPVQPEDSRSRHKPSTSQPVNDARFGAGRQVDQSRPHTSTRGYQSDTYVNSVPSSSNHNQPSTSRGYRPGHVQSAHKSATPQPQPLKSSNQTPQVSPVHYPQNSRHPSHHPPKAPPDVYDPRRHLHRNTAAASSPQSSVEKVSSTEDITRSSRHAPPRNSHDSRTPAPLAPSTSAMWIPPPQEGPSLRRQKHKETERETEEHANRAREKAERRKEKDRDILEKERAKEKERSREKRRANEQMLQEHRGIVKPPSSTRYYHEPRADDPDSSDSAMKKHAPVSTSRRRHRVEEVAPSHPIVCGCPLL
jgi:hypothetical protein